MATIAAYPETVETHMYWNLLKDLSDVVKKELVRRLNQSLAIPSVPSESDDAASQAAYYAILKKFNKYRSYQKGWDGEDASPLTSKVIENFCLVLENVDKGLLKNLTIFPETNGTLLIESRIREAGINLGDTSFSYYEITDNNVTGENGLPFSVEAIASAISRINK